MNRYKDVIGSALAYPGGYTVYGEGGGTDGAPQGGPIGFPQGAGFGPWAGYPGWCGAPPGQLDDMHQNRRLKTLAVGPACGPTEVEMMLGSDWPCDECVGAGKSITVKFTPQIAVFKAQALNIGDDIASCYVLTSLTAANASLLAGPGNIPGSALSSCARRNLINGQAVVGNQPIYATFFNCSGQPCLFSAVLFGVGIGGAGVQLLGGVNGY